MSVTEMRRLGAVEYIGDGVYVGHDGYQVWLCTSNGVDVTNEIALEPSVLTALHNWVARLKLNPDTHFLAGDIHGKVS